MRTLNIPLEDAEYEKLLSKKGEQRTWHDFVMLLIAFKEVSK